MTPPDRDKRRGEHASFDDEPSRPSSPDQTPLPRPVAHHVADPTVQPERVSASELDDDDIEELEPDEEIEPEPDEDLAAELATRQRPRISAEDLEKLERESEPELSTEQVASIPVSDSSDLFQRPRPGRDDDDPFEDEKTPPPAFLAEFAKHGPEDAETRPHEKADLADLAIDDDDEGDDDDDGRDD